MNKSIKFITIALMRRLDIFDVPEDLPEEIKSALEDLKNIKENMSQEDWDLLVQEASY